MMGKNLLLRFSLLRVIPAKFTSRTAQHRPLDILLRAALKSAAPYAAMGGKPVQLSQLILACWFGSYSLFSFTSVI